MDSNKEMVLECLQARMSYTFTNVRLLEHCLIAGDSNSDDREGNRGIAQFGDSLMGMVILSDGMERGLSRKEQENARSNIRSKNFCSRIAKSLFLDQSIKFSERQLHVGVQSTTLKSAVAALIGAVWLDSHEYEAVLRVMISIGLINHAQYYSEMQDRMITHAQDHGGLQETLLMAADLTPSSGLDGINISHGQDMPYDIGADYFAHLPENDMMLEDSFQPHSLCGTPFSVVSMPSVQTQSTGGSSSVIASASVATSISPQDTLEYTPPSSPDCSRRIEGQREQTPSMKSTAYCGSKVIKRYGRRQKAKAIVDNLSCIITMYISREGEKNLTSQEQARTTDILSDYQAAISKARATSQHSLATLATSIGDSSGLLHLKEAVQALRTSNSNDNCLNIDRQMTTSERIDIIRRIGACTALLKLARWLHIVTLWEELSVNVGDGSGGFINVTPDSVSRRTAKKGNPRNLARTEISRGMAGLQTSQDGARQSASNNNELRLLGQRLGLMVRIWGHAVLLILDGNFSEKSILDSTHVAFETLVTLIHQREGARILSVSNAALPILRELRQGRPPASTLRLESVQDADLRSLPRLSTSFEDLLKPAGQE